MAKHNQKSVLFLCTGNYYRSRFSEILFNSVAGKFGLSWKATSRGIALDRECGNIGPMAPFAVKALEQKGLHATTDFARFPEQVNSNELAKADVIVALQQTEHLPLMQERYPAWIEKAEFWEVDDTREALGPIEREVMDLISRLVSGRRRRDPAAHEEELPEVDSQVQIIKANAATVRVGRETKGRRGKGVVTVSDVPLDENELQELASLLKQRCGTGGTVKERRIEIQGDQRERVIAELEGLGYRVKRVGG